MKKVLSFVLVLAMILGSVSLAFATGFPDTEGTDYDEAARLLSDLGVLSGYADGTFKPENNVTRAEFAAMMIRALGFEVAGTSAVTNFSDVPASYWASTYIKYASELGIIYGYNDGTFRPKNNITNDEAIAMLIRTLGYQAKYMTGSYPTSHINVALGLDILDDIPTGSAAATRGTIAQLIFNAIAVPTVTYDGDGNIKRNGAPFLIRLGGTYYNGDEPFVVTGTESAVKGVNLNQYLGAYVTAYASKNDPDKIIAISKVHSEFVTDSAEIAAADFEEFAKDDKIGESKVRANAVNTTASAMAWAVFNNGKEVANLAYDADEVYTFAVKMDGNYVAKVYSVALWDPNDYFQMTEDMVEELKEDLTLNGHSFTYDNKDNIDTNTFGLFGVDSLDDIKEGNIVAVYLGTGAATGTITRIEVGTKTVDGEITRISAKNVVTVGGETYKQSLLDDEPELAVGQKGTFYLNYNGRIATCDTGAVNNVAVLMATKDREGDTHDQLAGAKSGAKVRLFTEDGKAVDYDVNKNAKNADGEKVVSAGAFQMFVNTQDDASDDVLVLYRLNADNQVTYLQVVGEDLDPATPVTKKGTAAGYIFNEDSVLFSWEGTVATEDYEDYSIMKLDTLLGNEIPAGSVYLANEKSKAVTAALLKQVNTVDDTYVAFNGADAVKGGYELNVVTADGKTTVYAASDVTEMEVQTAMLYKLSFSGEKVSSATKVTELSTPLTTTEGAISAKTKLVNGKNGYTLNFLDADGEVENQITVARDVVVLVMDDYGDWTVKSASTLNKLDDSYAIVAFDTKADKDVITYEVVFVTEAE